MISILAPSRGRPDKCFDNLNNWIDKSGLPGIEVIVSLDEDDPELKNYQRLFAGRDYSWFRYYAHSNRSAIDAINTAAAAARGEIFIVVSDDTDCFNGWAYELTKEIDGKYDFILKTKDGIQDYIITNPIFDRIYYSRLLALQNGVYHPDFDHLFCDTYLTCQADILGRKLTSNLMFKHNHYSVNGTEPDELHKRNDATWKQGQETFIRLMNQFTLEERRRIKDQSMKNWLRNKGVQI